MKAGPHRRAGGIVAFARTEWRTRWRAHLVIAVLAATAAAVLLTSFVAAARSRTSYDRLRDATHASDIRIRTTAGSPAAALDEVRSHPEVIDARAASNLWVRPVGSDLLPTFTMLALAPRSDDRTTAVDTPIFTAGRSPRPDRADEVALSARFARDLGVGPGDDVRLESMSHDWVMTLFRGIEPGPPDGPRATVTVTGIARTPADFGRQASVIHLTPAFVERHADGIERLDEIRVRVGPDALRRHQSQELSVLLGSPHEDSLFIDLGRTEDGLETIATALRLVGLVGGLAGTSALALALARSSRTSTADRSTLVALGWTRSDQLRALVLLHAPAVAIGLVIGLPLGVRASPWAMVHLARSIDPRPDAVLVDARLAAALIGGAVVVATALLLAVPGFVTRRRRPSPRAGARFPIGPPLALTLGIRHALMGPVDRGGRASRGAIAAVAGGAAVGVAGLVVSSSIGLLQHDASLTGERPERLVDGGSSIEAFDDIVARLQADERVAVLAGQHLDVVTVPGPGDVFVLVHEPLRGRAEPSITGGRMPRAADEVALGPATVEATGARVGEQIQVSGEVGATRFRVVGTALFPEPDFTYDDGIVLTVDGARRVNGDVREAAHIHQVFFEWADGVDTERADRALAADGFVVHPGGSGVRARPVTVGNLGAIEQLPRQLALLVGLLATASLLHATWTAVALRGREMVTLRALGVTRRGTSLLSGTQTLVIVGLGVLVGAPLGVVGGRAVWRPIAEDAHLVVRPVLSWASFAVLVGTAVLAAVAVASLAARWTSRLDPATTLRTE